MRKSLLVLTFLLSVLILVGCGSTDKVNTIGFVTDIAGLGDLAFNDAAYSGAQRAAEEFGYELIVLESADIADYENNIRALFNDGADAVVVAATAMTDVVKRLAPEYSDKKFLTFDIDIQDQPNVSATLFREQEAAFLLGALSGLITQTDKVGYVGGLESPLQERAKNGYEAGFLTTNPDGQVLGVYAGTYGDPGLGKEIADGLYNQGADYVASFAGAVNLGVFQSAAAMGDGYWALGAALGQFSLNPSVIVASQVKTIDLAVYTVIKELHEGDFKGGLRSAGILEGGVDLLLNPDETLVNSLISSEVISQIDALREQIKNGEIDIPITKDELANYRP